MFTVDVKQQYNNVFKYSGKDDFSSSSFCNCHSVRFSLSAYQKRKADSESEKAVSSDQPAQKKCKNNSGKFSRISTTVVEAV